MLVLLDPNDAPGLEDGGEDVDPAVYVIHRINSLLRDCGFRLTDYGDYRATGMSSLFDVLERIELLGVEAIAIPAHIDGRSKALRNALRDPETRVRMDEEYDPVWDRTVVEGLMFREGGSAPTPVSLNPGLNGVIGRKGTHKSTIIDLLIYGLSRFQDNPVERATEQWIRKVDYVDDATLYLNYDGRYRSVDYLPRGLANAAVMCLLMNQQAFGPLVIDEPEQWLDTPGITEVLVPRMRRLKARQQIICVTRDEHILLSGDAENVIVTDSEKRVEIGDSGDTNTLPVQQRILEIFEGRSDGRHLREKMDKLQGVLLMDR